MPPDTDSTRRVRKITPPRSPPGPPPTYPAETALPDNLRAAIIRIVNATLKHRGPRWWGNATTMASDSKRFGSWDSNLMTDAASPQLMLAFRSRRLGVEFEVVRDLCV